VFIEKEQEKTMRLTIPQPQFLKTLQAVERAVNDRTTLPILANVLLETSGNELTLTATDLDVGIRCRFPLVPPVEPGAVTLPARKLTTVVRELPEEPVVLESKKNHTATLNCGASSFRIPGLPPEDFPALPSTQQEGALALPQAALKRMITLTGHAMSAEETRFVLNGALLTAQKEGLVMVATDGRRLAAACGELTRPARPALHAVIPSKTVHELGRLLQDDEGDDVVIAPLKDNQLMFGFGAVTVVTRLIEGQFPPYEKVIPPASKASFTFDRVALINAVRRASLMTTATSQAVVFELSANRLVVSKESAELGSAREELAVSYTGEPMTVAFNPEFWLDVLKVLEPDEASAEVAGPDRPAVIRQPGFTYLVLPMKVA
jgi:DNA polymerase-3 subunit beta